MAGSTSKKPPARSTQFVALLRGINVGKAKRIAMSELSELASSLGLTQVSTLLNSGNLIFQSTDSASPDELATRIASAIKKAKGFEVPVVVVAEADFREAIATNPLGEPADPSQFLVTFCQKPETLEGLRAASSLLRPDERFDVGKRAAYLDCPGGILESKLGEALLGKSGQRVTTRNWSTCLKIVDRLAKPGL